MPGPCCSLLNWGCPKEVHCTCILGLLLFLMYINDLPEHITHSECYLFTDDVKLFKSLFESNSSLHLATDLSSLEDWCSAWKLKLNGRKCAHLTFTFSHKPNMFTDTTRYSVGGFNITSVTKQKDLGIIVTNTLSRECNYSKICKKKKSLLCSSSNKNSSFISFGND